MSGCDSQHSYRQPKDPTSVTRLGVRVGGHRQTTANAVNEAPPSSCMVETSLVLPWYGSACGNTSTVALGGSLEDTQWDVPPASTRTPPDSQRMGRVRRRRILATSLTNRPAKMAISVSWIAHMHVIEHEYSESTMVLRLLQKILGRTHTKNHDGR
ncbi:hypothetical protein C8Q73DRAFT_88640 [Cubamyces lactineus]|nr:hypothetical protein C8Q73DRAFT_88640 [Cubamyces lactineus]